MTIYDIAKMTGVSIATVSRVLNGSDRVSEKTRKRVHAVIEEVGYTPNIFAQGLGLNTMHTIGILVPTIDDTYMANAVAYLQWFLSQHNYDCLLSCSGFEAEGKKAQTEMLLSKHIDALIYVGSTYAGNGKDDSVTDYIREAAKQVPVFIINGNVKGDNIFASVCDDEKAVYTAAMSLFERGRKNLYFLSDSHSYSANEKKKGFLCALREKKISNGKNRIIYVGNRIHSVRDQLLSIEDFDCDGIIAVNDIIAAGAVKYAVAKKISIPDDIEIIGYNNSVVAVTSIPEITSVDNHTEEICRDTVNRIIHILSHDDVKVERKVMVSCELIQRDTTITE